MRRIASLVGIICGLLIGSPVLGNPQGGAVLHGSVQLPGLPPNTLPTVNVPQLNITNAPNTIINWQSFGINAGEVTQFIQQNAASAVLNRVVGQDLSALAGRLQSNGRVFLINPNGIIVGQGAVIDTAGFIASTLDMTNADFIAGKLSFNGDGSEGSIVNRGYIKASADGDVLLVAPSITNEAIIETEGGNVVLAAGKSVTITSLDDTNVQFDVQAPSDEVVNLGEIITNGGAAAIFAGSIRNSGHINANSLEVDAQGRVQLVAKDALILERGSRLTADGVNGGAVQVESIGGDAIVEGTISAAATSGNGGSIRVLGERVELLPTTTIDASGDAGGGEILIGGDYKGGNEAIANASQTTVGRNVAITADARVAGDGGKVVVWADDTTRYNGAISARGGSAGGDGGFVEVSGKQHLGFNGTVDTSAPHGDVGHLLLDPATLNVIDAAAGGEEDPDLPDINTGTDRVGGLDTVSWGAIDALAATTNITLEASGLVTIADVTGAAGGVITSADLVDLDLTSGSLTITSTGGNVVFTDTNDVIHTDGGAITVNASAGTANLGGFDTTDAGGAGAVTVDSGTAGTIGAVNTGGGLLTVNIGAGTMTQVAGKLIAGATVLTKNGNGTLLLSEANTYTGATIIDNGSIRISQDSNLGTAPGVATPGHLTLDPAGGLTNLRADGSFTLNANRGIEISAASTLFVSSGQILNYNGIVAGSGNVFVNGPGTLALGGINTFTGTAFVNGAGVLRVRVFSNP